MLFSLRIKNKHDIARCSVINQTSVSTHVAGNTVRKVNKTDWNISIWYLLGTLWARICSIACAIGITLHARRLRRFFKSKPDPPLLPTYHAMHAALSASAPGAREHAGTAEDRSPSHAEPVELRRLPDALAKYEAYVVGGGSCGLSKWLQLNGHAQGTSLEAPISIFAKARYSRTPIQDMWNSKDARARAQVEELVRHFSQPGSCTISETALSGSKAPPPAPVERKPEPVEEPRARAKEAACITVQQTQAPGESKERSLIDIIQADAEQHPVVFRRTAWFVPEDPARLTREEARSLYEQCYFLGYALGIPWHPDLHALTSPVRRPAGAALSMHCAGGENRMHPVALCAEMLSHNDAYRRVLATETMRAGGHFMGGWHSWLESGGVQEMHPLAKAKIGERFFGIIIDEEDEAMAMMASPGKVHDVHSIIDIKCKMSFQRYRECAEVFMGFVTSLPSMEYSRKLMPTVRTMSAREQQCIINMALFFCWLVLEVPAVRDVAQWEPEPFRKALGDALARKVPDIVRGMQEILGDAMRRARVSPSDPLDASALQCVLVEKSRVVRMTYYEFAQRVCNAVSAQVLACHAMSGGREDVADKIASAREEAGSKWEGAIEAICQYP